MKTEVEARTSSLKRSSGIVRATGVI